MSAPRMDGSSTPRCGICGGPATRTEITAGGEGLTPVVLCDAEVCKPRDDENGSPILTCDECARQAAGCIYDENDLTICPECAAVLRLARVKPGTYGWAITTPKGSILSVLGVDCDGLTRWEARQLLGMLGLPYEEDSGA